MHDMEDDAAATPPAKGDFRKPPTSKMRLTWSIISRSSGSGGILSWSVL